MYVSAPAAVWVETSPIAPATVAARVASRATIAVAFKNPSATPSVPRRRWPDAETNALSAHTKIEMRRRRGKPVSCRPTRSRRSLRRHQPLPPTPPGVRRFFACLVDGVGFGRRSFVERRRLGSRFRLAPDGLLQYGFPGR